jgi:hypothetical protein
LPLTFSLELFLPSLCKKQKIVYNRVHLIENQVQLLDFSPLFEAVKVKVEAKQGEKALKYSVF